MSPDTGTGTRTSRPLLAVLWMTGALASFTSMAVAARELTADLPVFQVTFIRTALCLLLLLPFAVKAGRAGLRTTRIRMHLGRNTIHFAGQASWIYGVSVLPLAAVFSLEFSTPVWTAILAVLFLKERLTRARITSVLLGFIGILVILRPGSELLQPASFVVIGAAVSFAFTYVFTRSLTATESAFRIIFYMNLIQFPLGLVPSLVVWEPLAADMLPFIAILGIAGLSSHYCVARALVHGDAIIVSPLDFLRLPLAALLGFLFYQEPWNPWVLLGGAITFAGNLLNIRAEQKVAGQKAGGKGTQR